MTGVDSATKLEMMRSIGFDHVIDYQKEDFTKNGKCYDLIVDTKTTRTSRNTRDHSIPAVRMRPSVDRK